MGPVQNAIIHSLSVGRILKTPTGRASFVIKGFDGRGVKIDKINQHITWEEFEGVLPYMNNPIGKPNIPRGIIEIGATKGTPKPDTLEECLRQTSGGKMMKASYAAPILEAAGVVEILYAARPMRIRLTI